MPLTVYEKNNVKGGMNAIVTGRIEFNVLNEPRTPKATKLVPDPKPEYVVALTDFKIQGDFELVKALQETVYADGKKISLRDKSPFPPFVFDINNSKAAAPDLIPEGKCVKAGTLVQVHVQTFDTPLNVGCGFDALKFATTLEKVPVVDAGGSVSASVFDDFNDMQTEPVNWE
jgi:hypothetical protein